MDMFTLLADPKQSDNTPVLFEDEAFQSVYDDIKQVFEENLYLSERGGSANSWYVPEVKGKKLLSNRELKYSVSAKARSLPASKAALQVILDKLSAMNQKLQELEDNERVQNQLIEESKQRIEQSHLDYTSAIVRGDDQGIQDVETQVSDWQTAIKHSEIRKKSIKMAKVVVSRIIEIMKVMRNSVDYRCRLDVYEKAKADFVQYLETVPARYDEYLAIAQEVQQGYGGSVICTYDNGVIRDLVGEFKRGLN